MKKDPKPFKISSQAKKYLMPSFPAGGARTQPDETDLLRFKTRLRQKDRGPVNRKYVRESIAAVFGKRAEDLTLQEYRMYVMPGFGHLQALKPLWGQLSAAEQDVVLRMDEWAFIFPASYHERDDFLRACAGRLQEFFGRKFHVKTGDRQKIPGGKPAAGSKSE